MFDPTLRLLVALVVLAAGGCFTTSGSGSDEAPGPDPGPPDPRWAQVSKRPLESVRRDPDVLACSEPAATATSGDPRSAAGSIAAAGDATRAVA